MEIPAEFQAMVIEDIKRIEKEVENGTNESRWELFRELDGKYQACIKDFYKGMWASSNDGKRLYINHLKEDPSSLLDNLKMIPSQAASFPFRCQCNCYGANAFYTGERSQ